MSRESNIETLITSLGNDPRFVQRQNQTIAAMVLFMSGMQAALKDSVPAEQVPNIAAILTAGVFASPDE